MSALIISRVHIVEKENTTSSSSAVAGASSDEDQNMNKVTRDDIKKYVNTYIIGKPRVVGLLLSPAMKAQLQIESLESYLNK